MHGGWSEWLGYDECSVTCGQGSQTRIRECDSPEPSDGGFACVGESSETKQCQEMACPGIISAQSIPMNNSLVWSGLQNLQFVSSGNVYYLGSLGSDCPVSDVVSNVEDCQAATVELRRTYKNTFDSTIRPAGCYYWSTDDDVYFNSRNPSDTHNIHSATGGVCKKSMLYIIQYKVYKHIKS